MGVTCSALWDVLVCVRLPSPSTEHSKDLWEHSLQGSPAPTTQAQVLQWPLQHKFSCVQVILYLRFSHTCQSSSEVALRKQSSSTAAKLHIDRAVVIPECSSCAGLPSEGCKGNSQPSLRADSKAHLYHLVLRC